MVHATSEIADGLHSEVGKFIDSELVQRHGV
jgi:hypothetical protein